MFRKLRGMVRDMSPARIRSSYHWVVQTYNRAVERREENRWRIHESRRLAPLKNRYFGQRCFIMGNGPSLNEMELDRFANEHVWCTNRAYLLFDRISWRPGFYTSGDRRVVPDIADELSELPKILPKTMFFWPLAVRRAAGLPPSSNVYWFREEMVDLESAQKRGFSRDCADYVVHPCTVTITALQLASYLGFDPIYLIGCDTNYVIPKSTKVDKENDYLLTSTEDDDPNHFDSSYFGTGAKWHSPHPEYMLRHYECVEEMCRPEGPRIFNATVGGKLEVFPRVNYLDVLSIAEANR